MVPVVQGKALSSAFLLLPPQNKAETMFEVGRLQGCGSCTWILVKRKSGVVTKTPVNSILNFFFSLMLVNGSEAFSIGEGCIA